MFFTFAMSSNLLGLWDFDSGTAGSIGVANGFKSSKLNLIIIIALIYACCERDIVGEIVSDFNHQLLREK